MNIRIHICIVQNKNEDDYSCKFKLLAQTKQA